MKRIVCICMAALMAVSTLVGCSTSDTTTAQTTASAPIGKVVINFEGTVTAVDGDEITLEGGKIIIISDDTIFAGDPDTNNAISSDIVVGNFIQGYTKDDPEAAQVSAYKIYCNQTK